MSILIVRLTVAAYLQEVGDGSVRRLGVPVRVEQERSRARSPAVRVAGAPARNADAFRGVSFKVTTSVLLEYDHLQLLTARQALVTATYSEDEAPAMSSSVIATSGADAASSLIAAATPEACPALKCVCEPMPSMGMPAARHCLTLAAMALVLA